MVKNLKKYSIVLCLAGAMAFAPVSSANAGSYHRGDRLLAAAVGGAVIGLVGAAVHNVLYHPNRTVVVEEPAYIETAPIVVVRPVYHHRPVRVARHTRHHRRHH